jgi:hypothetical protein
MLCHTYIASLVNINIHFPLTNILQYTEWIIMFTQHKILSKSNGVQVVKKWRQYFFCFMVWQTVKSAKKCCIKEARSPPLNDPFRHVLTQLITCRVTRDFVRKTPTISPKPSSVMSVTFSRFLSMTVMCRSSLAELPKTPLIKDCSALSFCCLNEGDRFDESSESNFVDNVSRSGRRLALMLYKLDDLLEGTYTTIGRYSTSQINCTLECESYVTEGRVSFHTLFKTFLTPRICIWIYQFS